MPCVIRRSPAFVAAVSMDITTAYYTVENQNIQYMDCGSGCVGVTTKTAEIVCSSQRVLKLSRD